MFLLSGIGRYINIHRVGVNVIDVQCDFHSLLTRKRVMTTLSFPYGGDLDRRSIAGRKRIVSNYSMGPYVSHGV